MTVNANDFAWGRNIGASRARADAEEAVAEWERHASDLKARLAKAESSRLGFAALARTLTAELARLDPTNSLLQTNVQLSIVEEHKNSPTR